MRFWIISADIRPSNNGPLVQVAQVGLQVSVHHSRVYNRTTETGAIGPIWGCGSLKSPAKTTCLEVVGGL